MQASELNQALAANLAYYMRVQSLTQSALAKRCGVAQTTISLYLSPDRRTLGKDGRPGSAKLTEVEMLAHALSVPAWELIRPFCSAEREAYRRIEEAYRILAGASVTAISSGGDSGNTTSPIKNINIITKNSISKQNFA